MKSEVLIGDLEMTEFMAEFVGTMILVLLGDGVVANVCLKQTKGHDSGWIVITLGWGFAVFTGVVVDMGSDRRCELVRRAMRRIISTALTG